ncbi:MAG: translation initiation factor IF-3 [Holophagae bacterium]
MIRTRKRLFREPPPKPEHRVNRRIRISPVRAIAPDGEQIGVIPVEEALQIARDHGLDLVEIAPDARPPVCKILDYGRFKYERDQREKEAKKRQSQIEIKEVKFRPNIGDHDFQTKLNRARDFLGDGSHVRLTVMFRWREMRRPENGFDLLERAREELDDIAEVASPPPKELSGRDLSMVVKPAR